MIEVIRSVTSQKMNANRMKRTEVHRRFEVRMGCGCEGLNCLHSYSKWTSISEVKATAYSWGNGLRLVIQICSVISVRVEDAKARGRGCFRDYPVLLDGSHGSSLSSIWSRLSSPYEPATNLRGAPLKVIFIKPNTG